MSELPPGFVLDKPEASALPSGFVLDKPSMGEDAAKSLAAGLGTATIVAAGFGGDMRDLASRGVDALGGKMGVDLSSLKTIAKYSPLGFMNSLPTSKDVRSTVTDPIIDPDYKPQYETGNLAKKTGEFLPGVLLGGPRSLLGKVATNVLAPAVGSEIGESVAGPLGGVAGALVGGVTATSAARKFQEMAAARNAAKVLQTGDQLVQNGGSGFNQARDMNVTVAPEWATSAAAKMRNDLKGFDPEAQGVVFKAADRLESLGKPSSPAMTPAQRLQAEMNWEPAQVRPPPPPVEINEVELIRKQLSTMKTDTNASVREAARRAIESLQESQMALSPAQTLRGNAAEYTQTLKNAIGDYRAGKQSQTLQGKVNLAELNQNSPVGMLDSGTGGQALQRTMKQLARPVNNTNVPVARKLGFDADVVSSIKEAANGPKMTHVAEMIDRLVPAKLGAIPAGIARHIGGLTTKRQVAAIDSLIRSRSPSAMQVAAQFPQIIQQLPTKTQSLLQTLALANPQLSKQAGQPVSQPNT